MGLQRVRRRVRHRSRHHRGSQLCKELPFCNKVLFFLLFQAFPANPHLVRFVSARFFHPELAKALSRIVAGRTLHP